MNHPKISIIVPIYNVEKYIKRCLISLFEQTFNDLEYIFIDDCGEDKSIQILKEVIKIYPNRQSQIKILYHKTNLGVSQCRQDGVECAKGDYIIHCDPDDWIEKYMCREMYNYAIENNSDILISDFFQNGKTELKVSQKPSSLEPMRIMKDMFQHLHGSCWNKLIKRSFIIECKVKFNTRISYCEDLLYVISLLKFHPKVDYLPIAFYHYYYNQNPNSITRLYSEKEYKKDLYLIEEILNQTLDTISYKESRRKMSYLLCWRAFRGSELTNWEFLKRFNKYILQVLLSKANFSTKILLSLASIGLFRFSKTVYLRLKG